MATSTNYGWAEPDNSSLVKNGASDIRTLGNAIDASVWSAGFGQAGKNKIINGDFAIWQRGTSFTAAGYTADRFRWIAGTSNTFSRQTFTPASAPVAGYESQYYARYSITTAGDNYMAQYIEDVRTFAGQTATVSFWTKASGATSMQAVYAIQNFGSGGSGDVLTTATGTAITTSWTRHTYTIAIPSISGKTVGTGSFLNLRFDISESFTGTWDIWGVQIEYGSVATPFQLAGGGSPQAELAMCQRYYWRITGVSYWRTSMGSAPSTTQISILQMNPVAMRVPASAIDYSTLGTGTGQIAITDINNSFAPTALSVDANASSTVGSWINATGASGLTQYRNYFLGATNGSSAYIGFSAEL
jgi:hypothetical protein